MALQPSFAQVKALLQHMLHTSTACCMLVFHLRVLCHLHFYEHSTMESVENWVLRAHSTEQSQTGRQRSTVNYSFYQRDQ